jgi:hypothetical protein
MLMILGVSATMFLYVILRALQQRNVAYDNYGWVIPTSYAMACADVFLITTVSKANWSIGLVFGYGTAGAAGALFAMWFHKRFIKR